MHDDVYPVQPVVRFGHHSVRSLQPVACRQRPVGQRAYNLVGGLFAWPTRVVTAPPRH